MPFNCLYGNRLQCWPLGQSCDKFKENCAIGFSGFGYQIWLLWQVLVSYDVGRCTEKLFPIVWCVIHVYCVCIFWWVFHESVNEALHRCFKYIWQVFQRCFKGFSQVFHRCFMRFSRIFQWNFRYILCVFQVCLVFLWCFMGNSWVLHLCYMFVSRLFQGFLKTIWMLYQWCLRGV